MDSELEKLKQHWQGLNNLAADAPCRGRMPSAGGARRLRSHSQKLVRDYTAFIAVSLIWVALAPVSLWKCGLPLWIDLCVSVFFGIMALSCVSIRSSLQRIDLGRMDVCEALECVEEVVKKRRRHQWLGIPLAVFVIAVMFYFFYGVSEFMFIGGVVGAILGSVVGVITDLKMRRMLDEMRDVLTDARCE